MRDKTLEQQIADAVAKDAAVTLWRYRASDDELYEWLRTSGPSVVDQFMSRGLTGQRILRPFTVDDAQRAATVTIGGGRIGEVTIRYQAVDGGLEGDAPSAELRYEGVWQKPRFLADSAGAGLVLQVARAAMWSAAAERFTKIGER